ncbi:unnamed protein product [Nippostrongylus brasiliensis]|uniref:Uncharacterized protein n=1 Tax=Nippostrongylus brasiliensis TaxID=27835 RepID=A0A0N4YYE7_NIPBR|nr:unnamed protein product [Nippostrongylus brasiliensis]
MITHDVEYNAQRDLRRKSPTNDNMTKGEEKTGLLRARLIGHLGEECSKSSALTCRGRGVTSSDSRRKLAGPSINAALRRWTLS